MRTKEQQIKHLQNYLEANENELVEEATETYYMLWEQTDKNVWNALGNEPDGRAFMYMDEIYPESQMETLVEKLRTDADITRYAQEYAIIRAGMVASDKCLLHGDSRWIARDGKGNAVLPEGAPKTTLEELILPAKLKAQGFSEAEIAEMEQGWLSQKDTHLNDGLGVAGIWHTGETTPERRAFEAMMDGSSQPQGEPEQEAERE